MITEYFRPLELAEAVALAARPDALIVGGGTVATTERGASPRAAVDLQALQLSGITSNGGTVVIGAMTTLQHLAEDDQVPSVLRELARRDAPSSIRNAATIGGAIGARDPESEFLTGLLALGATVTIAYQGSTAEHPLDATIEDVELIRGGIITEVSLPAGGFTAVDRTARTPMDRPIVSAVAHRGADGTIRLALSGVARVPALVDPSQIAELDPPADFRGSSEYRLHLAAVLSERVLSEVAIGRST
ncbi:MAG: FAD binding domain-containing protein [Acidimicrobiia bacterium]